MRRLSLALMLALSACAGGPAIAETVAGDRITVIDGDTVALPCDRPGRGCAEKLRLWNIDAPETFRSRCESEHSLGLKAKARMRALIAGRAVSIERCEAVTGRCKDHFGRTLGRLIVEAGDVGQILVAEGLALPWQAGAAARADRLAAWCGG